jgi:hypothetical protein
MKIKILLSTITLLYSYCAGAQADNKAFAITGNGNGDFQWMNIRQIDLTTGSVINNIYEYGKTKFSFTDAITNQNVASKQVSNEAVNKLNKELAGKVSSIQILPIPTQTMVAAAAYDKRNNKLFFTPMSINELRWLDLSSGTANPKFYSLQTSLLNKVNPAFEENKFTRMTIGADGNGYALTNDANHLIKFTTGKKVVITDLGSLVDATSNPKISIHNQCTSWGGDIVADAFGNLYLFTASKNVFKIDINKKIATYFGSITGLSGMYTVNGTAVDNEDNVIISSANTFEGFYKVNMKDLSAAKLNTTGQVFNASDLANGNLLFASQARNTIGVAPLVQHEVTGNQLISIYPNPVSGSQFKVTFNNAITGDYTIALTDIQGKIISTKQVYIKSAGQVETIQLKSKPANGMYLVNVTNINKKSVFSDKIVVE